MDCSTIPLGHALREKLSQLDDDQEFPHSLGVLTKSKIEPSGSESPELEQIRNTLAQGTRINCFSEHLVVTMNRSIFGEKKYKVWEFPA